MALDPLSHSTRLTKRNLLGVSAISLLHSLGWLGIDKITVWGEGILKDGALGMILGLLVLYLGISLGFRLFEDLQNPTLPPTGPSGQEASPRQARLAAAKDAPYGMAYDFLKNYLQSNFGSIQQTLYGDVSGRINDAATAAAILINKNFFSPIARKSLSNQLEKMIEIEIQEKSDRLSAQRFFRRWLILIFVLKSIPIYIRRILWSNGLYKTVSRTGQLFEYGFPYAIGALALYALGNPIVAEEWANGILT